MKIIVLVLALFVAPFVSSAQIVLTASDYPSTVMGTDSMSISTHSSLFPSFAPAINAVWDMTLTSDSTTMFSIMHVLSSLGTSYADSSATVIIRYPAPTNFNTQINTHDICILSETIFDSKTPLFPLTGGSNDTFFIVSQNSIYSLPEKKLSFPTTMSSSWQSSYQVDKNFELSLGIFSYIHQPGFMRRYTNRKDTVTGWGKMRIRMPDGSPSEYIPVLQVRTTTITQDSMYIDALPASPALVTLFGFQQGRRDTTYIQSYYRIGEVTPLAIIYFKDASFSTPIRALCHRQRLGTVHAAQLAAIASISYYPNPASQYIYMHLSDYGTYTYSLHSTSGSCVATGQFINVDGTAQISIPLALQSGMYTLTIYRSGSSSTFSTIVAIAK